MSRASNLAGFTTAIGVPANLNVGIITATSLSGSGANLTSLPAGQLTGTVADARISTLTASKLSGALPAIDGASLTGVTAAGLSTTASINSSGIITATSFSGDGSSLTGTGAAYNMIDNSEFLVNQRGEAAYTPASPSSGTFTLDRWKIVYNPAPNFEVTQDTDAPDGFKYSLKVENTSQSSTPPSYQYGYIQHSVEGYNSTALNWTGTAKQSATLSFYAKASIAGTWCVTIADYAGSYRYIATYTIDSADTWERKTITISAPSAGTFKDDNNANFRIYFDLGHASMWQTGTPNQWISESSIGSTSSAVNMADNVNSTFKVTGVQLEAGTSASDYVHQSYYDTLIRCQRYYKKQIILYGDASFRVFPTAHGTSLFWGTFPLGADTMRANPTTALLNNSDTQYYKADNTWSTSNNLNLTTKGTWPYVDALIYRSVDSDDHAKMVKKVTAGDLFLEISADI